jgi:hypothetical protein
MKHAALPFLLAVALVCPTLVLAQGAGQEGSDVPLDGVPTSLVLQEVPANPAGDGVATVDIVGSTANPATNTGRAKGNSYRVDMSVVLSEAEFWLSFTSTQTLTYYVFDSPVEFGTYTEVYRDSEVVTGTGAGWYSSGPLSVPLDAGFHYIIAVSFSGTLTYYYGTGDEQPTSFGAHTHGYATGFDPLPQSFQSLSNDQAIYHQRLTTDMATPVDASTWGAIKAAWQ